MAMSSKPYKLPLCEALDHSESTKVETKGCIHNYSTVTGLGF